MGILLLFPRANRPESEQIDADKDAELVMFPGVRYERREADDGDEPDTSPRCGSGG